MAQHRMKLADRVKDLATAEPEQPPASNKIAELPTRRTRSEQGFTGAAARQGKKATVGHFSEAMSRTLNAMAAMEGRTLQSLMGEAWDDLLVKRGKEPFNER